jgi:hypothetical protein
MSSIIQHQSIAAPKIATLSCEEYDKKRAIQKDEARIAENSEKRVALWRRKRRLPSKPTFHPFPRLPLELRSVIWTAIPSSHYLKISRLLESLTCHFLGECHNASSIFLLPRATAS